MTRPFSYLPEWNSDSEATGSLLPAYEFLRSASPQILSTTLLTTRPLSASIQPHCIFAYLACTIQASVS